MADMEIFVNSLERGDAVLIEMADQIVIGLVTRYCTMTKTLALAAMIEIRTNYRFSTTQLVPLGHIRTIKCMRRNDFGRVPGEDEEHPVQVVRLSGKELIRTLHVVEELVMIRQVGPTFHRVVRELRKQNVVSLISYPSILGRRQIADFIVLATCSAVYVFDMFLFGRIRPEMQRILEADMPKKAMHRSNRIVDQFRFNHHIDIRGIFDTFVGYCLLKRSKEPISLPDTISAVLKVPRALFNYQTQDETLLHTLRRPLSKARVRFMAREAVFLLKLHNYMVNDMMLKDIYNQSDELPEVLLHNHEQQVAERAQRQMNRRQSLEAQRAQGAIRRVNRRDPPEEGHQNYQEGLHIAPPGPRPVIPYRQDDADQEMPSCSQNSPPGGRFQLASQAVQPGGNAPQAGQGGEPGGNAQQSGQSGRQTGQSGFSTEL